jgi:hypothetical protein
MASTPTLNTIPLYCTIGRYEPSSLDPRLIQTRAASGALKQFLLGEKRAWTLGWDLVPETTYAAWPAGTYNTLPQLRGLYLTTGNMTFVTEEGASVTVAIDRAAGLQDVPTLEIAGMLFYDVTFAILQV